MNLSVWLNSVLFLLVSLVLILVASLFSVMELGSLFSDLSLVKASGSLAQFFSVSFLLGIALISILVFTWARFYMHGSTSLGFFFYTLLSFVLSMMLLVFSDSFLSVFLGWEGLGVTSFMLIIFYQNWMSMKGGLLTLLTNRLGDGLLLLSLSYWVMNFSFLGLMRSASLLAFLFFLSTTFTKSAQVPFTSWLPAAMAAPTPVSALVHSSTLVTAGIWLLVRFGQQLMTFSILSIFFGLSTLITASLSALAETDGKKVVALSTLSQLGLMYLSLSLGGAVICLFHLLMHAFAKANLFLMVGNFIHSSFSQQDSRQSSSGEQSASAYLMMVISLLSLSGMVFFSGFFSKDLILILQYPLLNSVVSYGIILSVVSLTFSYCFKLILTLLSNSKSGPIKEKLMSKAVLLPSMVLTVLSVLMGWFFVFNSGAPLLWKQSMSGFYWLALLLVFLVLLSLSKKGSVMIYLFMIQIKLIDLFNQFSLIKGKMSSLKSTSSMTEPVYLFSSFFMTKLSNLAFTRIVLILLLSMVIIFNC